VMLAGLTDEPPLLSSSSASMTAAETSREALRRTMLSALGDESRANSSLSCGSEHAIWGRN
jgi:hypothetical protein